MQLVFLETSNRVPYTTHRIIAECAGVNDITVRKLIDLHKTELERFGKVSFEMTALPSGQQGKNYRLNEQQATLLITFMRNTEAVTQFKMELVKQFFELKAENERFSVQRLLEKPERKVLNAVIDKWKHRNKRSYVAFANLLTKKVTGLNVKQLKQQRAGFETGLDALTSSELEQYRRLEKWLIALLEMQLEYTEIKNLMNRATA